MMMGVENSPGHVLHNCHQAKDWGGIMAIPRGKI
jgi:hypothetical protein